MGDLCELFRVRVECVLLIFVIVVWLDLVLSS